VGLNESIQKYNTEIAENSNNLPGDYAVKKMEELYALTSEKELLEFYFMTDVERIQLQKGMESLMKKWKDEEDDIAATNLSFQLRPKIS
jgi:hypothetical protein